MLVVIAHGHWLFMRVGNAGLSWQWTCCNGGVNPCKNDRKSWVRVALSRTYKMATTIQVLCSETPFRDAIYTVLISSFFSSILFSNTFYTLPCQFVPPNATCTLLKERDTRADDDATETACQFFSTFREAGAHRLHKSQVRSETDYQSCSVERGRKGTFGRSEKETFSHELDKVPAGIFHLHSIRTWLNPYPEVLPW
jgi:hypothetical protein